MYRVNAVVMVLLCIVVMGFAAVMAFHISGDKDRQKVDDHAIARLILRLSDEDPAVGDRAEKDLTAMGNPVLPNIRSALVDSRGTLAIRLNRIIRSIEGPPTAIPQP